MDFWNVNRQYMNISYTSNAAAVIARIKELATDSAAKATYEYVFLPSQSLVPLDETPLQESGDMEIEGSEIVISYGRGHSAEYAIIQHENLQYAHAPGRQAKFLETPFRSAIPQIIGAVADSLKGL